MLYLYIVLKARIPNMFAYMKIMEEFSTNYVRSISRYGYCMTTLEVVMEMLQTHSLSELIQNNKSQSVVERSQSFSRNFKKSLDQVRIAAEQRLNSSISNKLSVSNDRQRPRVGVIRASTRHFRAGTTVDDFIMHEADIF